MLWKIENFYIYKNHTHPSTKYHIFVSISLGDGIHYQTHSQHQCTSYESMADTSQPRLGQTVGVAASADSVPLQSIRIDAANEEQISVDSDSFHKSNTIVVS